MTMTDSGPRRTLLRSPAVGPARDDTYSAVAIDFGTSSSTVTLVDSFEGQQRALRPAQAAELAGALADLLVDPSWPPPRNGQGDFPAAVTGLAGKRLEQAPADAAELATWLRRASQDDSRLAENRYLDGDGAEHSVERGRQLDACCLAFEEVLHLHRDLLAHWLAPRLHAAYDKAFDRPSLDSYNLTPVQLNKPEWDVPSLLAVSQEKGAVVGKLRREFVPQRDLAAFPSVKRFLSRPEQVPELEHRLDPGSVPQGWQVDTDLLIGLAYADLADLLDDYADGVRSLQGRSLRRATVTYPTTTPPGPRRRLKQLLYDALDLDADISYDEATAAALFFVMRELGGDTARGIETLRATSRRSGPGSWLRTMLVIDIGGGTTDIALLDVELKELDSDQDGTDERNLVRGKHYLLRPRILGSSGHAQLGGDLLTLKVFYWMKAVIADALLIEQPDTLETMWAVAPTTAPTPALLAPLVVGFRQADAAPVAVRTVLREILPTHVDGREAQQYTEMSMTGSGSFRTLWGTAEEAKRTLAAGNTYTLSPGLLGDLGAKITGEHPQNPWSAALESLRESDLTFSPDEFAVLARPLLDEAMTLAGALVRSRLGGGDQPVLDVVALSGRTCGMPAAREAAQRVLNDRLLDRTDTGRVVQWDSDAIKVETDLAKQAASIGACWARSSLDNRAAGPVATDVGDTIVDVLVDNLLVHLPCGFDLGEHEANKRRLLLPAGTRLDRSAADGSLQVESGWQPIRPEITVNRRIDGPNNPFIRWGRFVYQDRAVAEAAEQPGGPPPRTTPPSDVMFSVVLDQGLTPTLQLRRGRWSVIAVDSPLLTLQLPAAAFGYGTLPPVSVQLLHSDQPPVLLFTPDSALDQTFTLLDRDRPYSVRGAIAGAAFPVPEPGGLQGGDDSIVQVGYQLWLDRDGGDADPLGDPIRLNLRRQPNGAAPTLWATLDEEGWLRIVSGYPPYLKAWTLSNMENAPGSVYTTPMDDVRNPRDPWRDPFNGRH